MGVHWSSRDPDTTGRRFTGVEFDAAETQRLSVSLLQPALLLDLSHYTGVEMHISRDETLSGTPIQLTRTLALLRM